MKTFIHHISNEVVTVSVAEMILTTFHVSATSGGTRPAATTAHLL